MNITSKTLSSHPLAAVVAGVPEGLRLALSELVAWVATSEEEAGSILPELRDLVGQVAHCWSRPHVTDDRVGLHLAWFSVGVYSTDDMLRYLDAYVTSTGDAYGVVTISDTSTLVPFVAHLCDSHGVTCGADAIEWARAGGKYEANG